MHQRPNFSFGKRCDLFFQFLSHLKDRWNFSRILIFVGFGTFQSQKEGETFNYDRGNMRKVFWKLSGSKGKAKAFKILGKREKVLLLNLWLNGICSSLVVLPWYNRWKIQSRNLGKSRLTTDLKPFYPISGISNGIQLLHLSTCYKSTEYLVWLNLNIT